MWKAIAGLFVAVITMLVLVTGVTVSNLIQRTLEEHLATPASAVATTLPPLQWSFYPYVDQNLRCWVVESQYNAHAIAMWCERYQP